MMFAFDRERWSHTTPTLWFACFVFTFGDVLFGIDTGSFGSLQALPSWLAKFGETIDGKRTLSTQRRSTMNSVVWIGKLAGTMVFEPILEATGYRVMVYIICGIQTIAIIVELTAKDWIVFSVGRVLAYLAVGMVENCVANYTSEVSPVYVRGLFTGSLLMFNTLGNLWGTGMSNAYKNVLGDRGWMIPTGMQLVPSAILMIFVPFCPGEFSRRIQKLTSRQESPRWLVSRGQKEKALRMLNRLRPRHEVEAGLTIAEIEAFEEAIDQSRVQDKGSWIDLFRGTYFRRTMIATGWHSWLFIFEQSTGSQFVVSYQTVFLTNLGLGGKAFTYTVINNAMGVLACLITMILYDVLGRRPIIIGGGIGQILFMILIGALGSKAHPSTTEINTVVASIILFFVSVKISYSTCSFLMGSEIGGTLMRKKILAWGIGWDIVAACVWTVVVPYLLGEPGANLGPKVGYIFAGISVAALGFAIFFVPELKGRSLEETDELFEMRLWAWQFNKAETTGVGARIAQLEQGNTQVENWEKARTENRESAPAEPQVV